MRTLYPKGMHVAYFRSWHGKAWHHHGHHCVVVSSELSEKRSLSGKVNRYYKYVLEDLSEVGAHRFFKAEDGESGVRIEPVHDLPGQIKAINAETLAVLANGRTFQVPRSWLRKPMLEQHVTVTVTEFLPRIIAIR